MAGINGDMSYIMDANPIVDRYRNKTRLQTFEMIE